MALFAPIRFSLDPATTLVNLPLAPAYPVAPDAQAAPDGHAGPGVTAPPAAPSTTLGADTTPDYAPWAAGFVEEVPAPDLVGLETSILADWGVIDLPAPVPVPDIGLPDTSVWSAAALAPLEDGPAGGAQGEPVDLPVPDVPADDAGPDMVRGPFGWVEPPPPPEPAPTLVRGPFGFVAVEPDPEPPPPQVLGPFGLVDGFLF